MEEDEGLAKGRRQEEMVVGEIKAAMMVGGAREERRAGGNRDHSQDEGPWQGVGRGRSHDGDLAGGGTTDGDRAERGGDPGRADET
ncbi:hypothetical protein PO909_010577 [Leuciscus waleckii]